MDAGYNIMLQYILLGGLNDDLKYAHELGKMFKGKKVVLNLIPYNPTDVKEAYKAPSEEQAKQFDLTVRTYGILTFIRQEKGQDIAGACGQLVVSKTKSNCGPEKQTDIEDLVVGAGSSTSKPTIFKRKNNNQQQQQPQPQQKMTNGKSEKKEKEDKEEKEEQEEQVEVDDKLNNVVKNAEKSLNRVFLFCFLVLIAIFAFLFRKKIQQTLFF